MSSHLTQWEQVGDTLTGKGLIRFCNKHDNIVATLPTYRKNHRLWFTELKAIPADIDQPAVIQAVRATKEEEQSNKTAMAMTDSDRHYLIPENMGGGIPKIKVVVETVENDESLGKAVKDDVKELFPDTMGTEPQEEHNHNPKPYEDPHIPPPDEPPPKSSRKKNQELTPHHADDDIPTPRPVRKHCPMPCCNWHGTSPPVPKQRPTHGGQLQTEFWHQ
jgi:hypothetical protein